MINNIILLLLMIILLFYLNFLNSHTIIYVFLENNLENKKDPN